MYPRFLVGSPPPFPQQLFGCDTCTSATLWRPWSFLHTGTSPPGLWSQNFWLTVSLRGIKHLISSPYLYTEKQRAPGDGIRVPPSCPVSFWWNTYLSPTQWWNNSLQDMLWSRECEWKWHTSPLQEILRVIAWFVILPFSSRQCPRQRLLHPSKSQLRAQLAHSDPLTQLGLLQQILETVWLNQQTFIPPSSGGWQVHDQCASLFGVWWEFSVCKRLSSGCSLTWKAETHTHTHTERERERERVGGNFSLYKPL